jgi:hypothetical protein
VDFYLLDNNLLRTATKSPGNLVLGRLIPQLRSRGFDFGEAGTVVRITPFGLLEALGIRIHKPPQRTVTVGDPKLVYKELFEHALVYFQALPELQPDHLRKKYDEQILFLDPEARPLFDICVSGFFKRDLNLTSLLATFLAQDAFLNYPFSLTDFRAMLKIMASWYFIDEPPEAPASRFRVSVRMHYLLKAMNPESPPPESFVKALRLKNDRDYLDTDIIQELTYGFPFEGNRRRVIALTCDDAETVEIRARHHRNMGHALADRLFQSDPITRQAARSFLDHPGGLIIQVAEDGNILKCVDLKISFADDLRGHA